MGKIYTKGGDGGFSVLSSDMKISKADERFEALGCIDELSSHIGLCRAIVVCPKLNGKLQKIQSVLSKIASGITYPNDISYAFDGSEIAWLEEKIDNTQNSFDMGGEKNLGKCELSARLDVCAAVCRRLERALVSAGRKYNIPKSVIAYINRLSDYFFVLARRIDFDDANGNLSQIVGNKSINGQNANEISGGVINSIKQWYINEIKKKLNKEIYKNNIDKNIKDKNTTLQEDIKKLDDSKKSVENLAKEI